MEWSRIKSILIYVFAAVNIFLLLSYFKGFNTNVSIDDKTIENTVTVLSKNNVHIDKSIIPKKHEDMRMFDAENKYPSAANIAAFISPDATSVKDNFEYINRNAEDSIINLNQSTAKRYAEKEMKRLNLLGNGMLNTSVEAKGENFVICFTPIYDSKKILDVNLYVEVSKSGIVKIFGQNWLIDNFTDSGITSVTPVSEILITFATDPARDKSKPSSVTSIEIGYFLGSRGGQIVTVTAVPVWKITTSEGNVYYYDVRNGDLLVQ